VRLPQNTNDDIEEDPTGTKSLWDRGLLSGASQKAECVAVCHLGMGFLQLFFLQYF
jgi:splicing factor 3B subunit 3